MVCVWQIFKEDMRNKANLIRFGYMSNITHEIINDLNPWDSGSNDPWVFLCLLLPVPVFIFLLS